MNWFLYKNREFWKNKVKEDLPKRKQSNLRRNAMCGFKPYHTYRFEKVEYSYNIG